MDGAASINTFIAATSKRICAHEALRSSWLPRCWALTKSPQCSKFSSIKLHKTNYYKLFQFSGELCIMLVPLCPCIPYKSSPALVCDVHTS